MEVLSPSTRSKDLLLKRGLNEDSGVESYWIVDPDEVSVTVLELVGDGTRRPGTRGDEVLGLDRPFPVRLCARAALGGGVCGGRSTGG